MMCKAGHASCVNLATPCMKTKNNVARRLGARCAASAASIGAQAVDLLTANRKHFAPIKEPSLTLFKPG